MLPEKETQLLGEFFEEMFKHLKNNDEFNLAIPVETSKDLKQVYGTAMSRFGYYPFDVVKGNSEQTQFETVTGPKNDDLSYIVFGKGLKDWWENCPKTKFREITQALTSDYGENRLAAEKWLRDKIAECTDEDGCYKIEPCDYSDYIHETVILENFQKYCENNEGYDSFELYLYDHSFIDIDTERDLFREIKEIAKDELDKDIAYEVETIIDEGRFDGYEKYGYNGTTLDVADFLNYDYHINLMLATRNERNLDMGAIKEFFIDEPRFNKTSDSYDNALSYLIQQQGHTVQEAKDIYDGVAENISSPFLVTVSDELSEISYGMNELTVLITAKGRDLLDLLETISSKEKNKELTVTKGTSIGLFNEWEGAGSMFTIALDKPFTFPADMVRNVQIEYAGKINRGYTVAETFEFVGKVWNGRCTVSDEKERVKKNENIER